MAESNHEMLYSAARQIAKTLGKDDDVITQDILQILSSHTSAHKQDQEISPVRSTSDSLNRQISTFVSADHPLWSQPSDSAAFLDAVDNLIATGTGDKFANELIQKSMFRLQDEIGYIMDQEIESFDESESDEEDDYDRVNTIVANPVEDLDQFSIEPLPNIAVNDLREIAKRMVAGGFGQECCHAYSGRRREFLEESMSRLRLKKLSSEEIHETPWQDKLEDEIDRWVKAFNLAVRVFFPSEYLLCRRVFSGLQSSSSSLADLSFMEVCRGTMTQLLNFADAIAIGSRSSPERLFKVLDLFETLRDLMPQLETLFSDQYTLPLVNEAIAVQKRLGEAIRGIFMELENLIRRDPAKKKASSNNSNGGIHPITRYVMNYLRAACKSRQTLEQLFEENSKGGGLVMSKEITSPLSVQIAWTLELLESNLEAKSKTFGDPALCFVFLMNNCRYIVDKVKDGELGMVLGEDWIGNHTGKLRQYRSNYRRSSWNQLVAGLKLEDAQINNDSSKSMIERLRLFNLNFREVCETQSRWVVSDEQLREELQISVARLVLPVYRNFIERFISEMSNLEGKHIVYNVDDVEYCIKQLFQGT